MKIDIVYLKLSLNKCYEQVYHTITISIDSQNLFPIILATKISGIGGN